MTAIRDIAAERKRQIKGEGFSLERDDGYRFSELASAAACYAEYAALGHDMEMQEDESGQPAPPGWPWAHSWWNPTSARRALVKAGALVAAEIERLDRITERCEHPVHSNPGMIAPCPECQYDPMEYQDRSGAFRAEDPFAKIVEMFHLLIECRDVLPVLSSTQVRLHKISRTLATRIEDCLDPWEAEPGDPDAI